VSGQRQAAKDVTRAVVLAAARREFEAKGFEGANVRDIAAAAGRSTGSVFGNWKSKEELFEAAMDRKAPMVVVRDLLVHAVRYDKGPLRGLALAETLLLDLFGEQDGVSRP
jgi:AcrR family transcriptional regulator